MANQRQQTMTLLIGLMTLGLLPSGAAAQPGVLTPGTLARWKTPSLDVLQDARDVPHGSIVVRDTETAQARGSGPSRDTLRNGAILGAIVGAATLGAFAAILCRVQEEPGTGNCAADTLRVSAIGAGIGAGAGLAVDAMLARQSGVTLRVRIGF